MDAKAKAKTTAKEVLRIKSYKRLNSKLFHIRHERDLEEIGESKLFLIIVRWNASSQQPKPGLSLLAPIVAWEAHRGDPQQVSIQRPKHINMYLKNKQKG